MARIRFATAREVFEAFPVSRDDIEAAPSDEPPQLFVKALLDSATPEDAIGFSAYMLPRREAVWWACQCLRAIDPMPPAEEAVAIQFAEAWVREPEEHRRRAALEIGERSDDNAPATWAALAAAWSGGNMMREGQPVQAPPHLTAKAARAAVLIALARVGAREREARLRACIESALRLVSDETVARSAG
jgi:hypothetical protein